LCRGCIVLPGARKGGNDGEAQRNPGDGKDGAVCLEYEDGTTHVIISPQLPMPSFSEHAAAKVQIVNRLKQIGADLLSIEADQIIIERAAA
jgi:hypothetical protein